MLEVVGYSVVVPAVVAIAAVCGCQRVMSEAAAKRYAAAMGLGVAFAIGYVLLPSWANLAPARHWQWLPWLGLAAALIGPIAVAKGVSLIERWLLYLLLAFVSAWLLVPNWASLEPPRSTYVPLLCGYLFLLAACLEPLPGRVSCKLLLDMLAIAGAVVAATIATFVSLRYGRIAGIAAAGAAGCGMAAFRRADRLTTQALVPAFAVLIGGSAFVGLVEPQHPLLGLALIPLAPATLWSTVWKPIAQLNPRAMLASQVAVVLVSLGIAIAVTWYGLAE